VCQLVDGIETGTDLTTSPHSHLELERGDWCDEKHVKTARAGISCASFTGISTFFPITKYGRQAPQFCFKR
jgi:hypothetical protein